jgi:hypothetical protein
MSLFGGQNSSSSFSLFEQLLSITIQAIYLEVILIIHNLEIVYLVIIPTKLQTLQAFQHQVDFLEIIIITLVVIPSLLKIIIHLNSIVIFKNLKALEFHSMDIL